ncbi:MAG: chemotaxis protein CheX [Magnetococcales bacterium]|nr:chemotaxis protein CheX [Magnetococcales bacterium]
MSRSRPLASVCLQEDSKVSFPARVVMKNDLPAILIASVHDVFLSFLAIELFPGPFLHTVNIEQTKKQTEDVVTAVVGFSGAINGRISFSCSLTLALQLSSSVTGKTFSTLSTEASDVFADLVNLVASWFRVNAADHGKISTVPAIVFSESWSDRVEQDFSSGFRQTFQINDEVIIIDCFY